MREFLIEAANILDVSEFEVLRRAYHSWHGSEASPQELDRTYAAYLQASCLPAWAQHYARKVTDEFQTQHAARCRCPAWFLLVVTGKSIRYREDRNSARLLA